MSNNANTFGNIIGQRASNEAYKQASAEVKELEATIMAKLDKMGLPYPSAMYDLIADARDARADALVRAKLSAVADVLLGLPQPVTAAQSTGECGSSARPTVDAVDELTAEVKALRQELSDERECARMGGKRMAVILEDVTLQLGPIPHIPQPSPGR